MGGEVVAEGLFVPEGPTLLPDGRVAFVEQLRGRVSVFDGNGVAVVAEVGGAANAVALGDDDALYACQNGGVVGAWRSSDPRPPGIQRVGLDGSVAFVATEVGGVTLLAPNDLAFGPDGRLYFTDPAHGYDPVARGQGGRIFALGAGGGERLAALDPVYCNGIGFAADGRLLWVESYERHLCTLGPGGTGRVELGRLPEGHVPDGFAVAADGRIFVASVTSHGITVLSPEGDVLDHIRLDERAIPSNCCFDGGALWVTDFSTDFESDPGTGRLWRVETDATGLPLHRGRLAPQRMV